MAPAYQTVATGSRRHWVRVENPGGPAVPDGDGGFTTSPVPAGRWRVRIVPAAQRELERVAAGVVIGSATHVITGRYFPGLALDSEITFRGRRFRVAAVLDPGEMHVETIALAQELTG